MLSLPGKAFGRERRDRGSPDPADAQPAQLGLRAVFPDLRNVKGYRWNHKRVYRIYRELELNLRIKPKKRIVLKKPEPLTVPQAINQCWSMDFIHNWQTGAAPVCSTASTTSTAKPWPSTSICPTERAVRALDQVIEWRGKPATIRSDNGPEYVGKTLIDWARRKGVRLEYIQPGKPQQNKYVERYNCAVRYNWLGHYLFDSSAKVQDYATNWMWICNHERSNMTFGGITPKQKLFIAA